MRAQNNANPYAAEYCEPDTQTKLLYTNRAYLILDLLILREVMDSFDAVQQVLGREINLDQR